MIELPEYMTWNMYLKQNAKYVINYGRYAQYFYSERAVINFLHQNRYRWRNVKSLGNGEWETKDKRMKIRKINVTAATNRHKTNKMATIHYINPWLHLNAEKSSVVINTTDIYAVEYQDVEDGIKIVIKWDKRSLSFVIENSDSVVSLIKTIEGDTDSPTTFLVHKLKWNMSL